MVKSANYSPDGKYIVIASDKGTIKIFESETGKLIRTLEGHSAQVNGANYSPDCKNIVSFSDDGTIKIWDSETGTLIRTLEVD